MTSSINLLQDIGLTPEDVANLSQKQLRELWIQKLREFPHKQIPAYLGSLDRSNDEMLYCCLGIAGIITEPESCWVYQETDKLQINYSVVEEGETEVLQEDLILTESVYKKLGLVDGEGTFRNGFIYYDKDGIEYGSLTDMNDAGISWLVIADLIKNHPEHIFYDNL